MAERLKVLHQRGSHSLIGVCSVKQRGAPRNWTSSTQRMLSGPTRQTLAMMETALGSRTIFKLDFFKSDAFFLKSNPNKPP
jgi:hypothetical protein